MAMCTFDTKFFRYIWSVRIGTTDTEHALAYGSYDKDVDNNGGYVSPVYLMMISS